MEQAKNMVMTEEELDYLASLKVRARAEGKAEGLAVGRAEGKAEGIAEGRAEGRAEGFAEGRAEGKAEGRSEGKNEGHADAIDILQGMGLTPEQVDEFKARLEALNGKK